MLIEWFQDLPALPRGARMLLVALLHAVVFALSFWASFMLRFDFMIPPAWAQPMLQGMALVLCTKLVVFALFRMYQGWWRYVSLYDLVALMRSLVIAQTAVILLSVFSGLVAIPRAVYLIDFGLSLVMLGGARGSLRLVREAVQTHVTGRSGNLVRILIVGAGDTGEMLLREIGKNVNLPYHVVGFLDDDPRKKGLRIHNALVLGSVDQLSVMVEKYEVDSVIIAMPSANRQQMRRVIDLTKAAGVEAKVLPAVEGFLQGDVALSRLREVSISDLLGRAPVKLDMQSIGKFLQGRCVMVTGAGGSIGSELCRQVLRFAPGKLVMVERAETPLFFIHRELRQEHAGAILPYVASISDADRMAEIFAQHKPEVILHAAAYKHVPLMEANPCEAVKNNVRGTEVIAQLASAHGTDTFVLISTDKAVNPTSVMGATKRITELLIMGQQQAPGNTTRFCAVRFGNVLGSNGSVVPIFREQLRQGGPLTVTHKEMTRYFMTIPEAVQLVLQAGALGAGGEIFLLDMGEPVKISDLARDMIRLSGLDEQDIGIVYTGVRPGEKLFEELAIDPETMDRTRHEKIFIAPGETQNIERMAKGYERLLRAADLGDGAATRRCLKELIPEYVTPQPEPHVISLASAKIKKANA